MLHTLDHTRSTYLKREKLHSSMLTTQEAFISSNAPSGRYIEEITKQANYLSVES
ncbi:hypothetical protein Hanom_Chr16g01467711 [Helianthus anomalus]